MGIEPPAAFTDEFFDDGFTTSKAAPDFKYKFVKEVEGEISQ